MEYKCLHFIFKPVKQPKDVPESREFLLSCEGDMRDGVFFGC